MLWGAGLGCTLRKGMSKEGKVINSEAIPASEMRGQHGHGSSTDCHMTL